MAKLTAKLNLGARLALGFAIVQALTPALAASAISRMSFIHANLDQIVEADVAKLRLVNSTRDMVRYQSVTIRDVLRNL